MDKKHLKQFEFLSEKGKGKVLKSLEMEYMKESTLHRLKTNKAIQQFFSRYAGYSVEPFITSFVQLKEYWLSNGDEAKKRNEDFAVYFHKEARRALKEILRKKLLMKVCEWSAGLVELEGVEISADFHYWNEDVMNCPFLELITPQEIDLYKQHFSSHNFAQHDWICPPYTYYFVKRDGGTNADSTSEPEFSMFYDTYMGTSSYWLLPDIRCVKERYYRKIFDDDRMKKYHQDVAEGKIILPKQDHRPYFKYYENKELEKFIERFESAELLNKYREYTFDNKRNDEQISVEEERLNSAAELAPYYMKKLGVHLPVEAADDYRVALKQTWDNYKQQQILKTIDTLYEDYLFRKQSGIGFERDEEQIKDLQERFIEYQRMEIREGRRLLGEPPDLNIF